MAVSILVTSGKGGTGKTTVSLLLARAFAEMERNVLLLEFDCGLRGLDLMLSISNSVVFDISDILTSRCRPAKAITEIPTNKGNFHFIAAPMDRHFKFSVQSLTALLTDFSRCYDYVILDTSAGLGDVFDAVSSICDIALVVTTCDQVALRAAGVTVQELNDIPSRLVINAFRLKQLCSAIPTLDTAIDMSGAQLISVIPHDLKLIANIAAEQYKSSSDAAGEVYDLAKRLEGAHIPLNQKRLR